MTSHDDDTPRPDESEEAGDSTESGPAASDASTADMPDDGTSSSEGLPEEFPLTPEDIEDEAIRGDFVLRWLVVLVAVIVGCTAIRGTATLLHVKAGQHMAGHGWLPPAHDVFSYTAADREWVNPAWLFDLFLAGVFAMGGPVGLTILKMVAVAIVFILLVHIGKRGISTWWGSVCAALALLTCHVFLKIEPRLVTLVGIAIVLWISNRWRNSDTTAGIWWLVPVFLVWANLDPFMFVGAILIVAYGIGEAIGAAAGRPGISSKECRLHYWGAVGASLVATLLNPFGWKVWAAPMWWYALEIPTLRSFTGETAPSMYQPLFSPAMWASPLYFTVAGVILLVATFVVLVLNRRQLDWGDAAVWLAFVGLAAIASHELGAASLVCAALATVNAQEWYAANFRQTYSVDTEELIFTRGGRAATIVGFVAIVFLAVSGRLEGVPEGLGLGWAPEIAAGIAGLDEDMQDAPPEQRTFNLDLIQADLLIWNDRPVFIDRRISLYRRGGDDLAAIHRKARHALQSGKESSVWKKIFDRFGIESVIARLDGNRPDYASYLRLVASPEWALTQLGSTAAVFHRTDIESPSLREFIEAHRMDFLAEAFRIPDPLELEPRLATPPGFYARYFDDSLDQVPNSIQLARHYASHRPQLRDLRLQTAVSYLAIRHANAGLLQDPDCGLGYRILGDSYLFLRRVESIMAPPERISQLQNLRYFQTLSAYHQSLLVEPEWAEVHRILAELYLSVNKLDLARREFRAYDRMLEELDPQTPELRERRERIRTLLDRIAQASDRFERELVELDAKDLPLATRVRFAHGHGYVLRTIELLESHPDELRDDEQLRLLHAVCLLESGHLAEAVESLNEQWRNYGSQQQNVPPDLFRATALARIAQGSYQDAIEYWSSEAESLEAQRLPRLMLHLPFTMPADFPFVPLHEARTFPFAQIQQAYVALDALPARIAELRLMIAVSQIETGRVDEAAETIRHLRRVADDTPLWSLVRFYFTLLTGEEMEIHPPRDRIPIFEGMFAEESAAPLEPATDENRSETLPPSDEPPESPLPHGRSEPPVPPEPPRLD